MKRRIYTREELSEVFRINESGELERLNGKYSPNGVGWSVVDCKCNTNTGYCQVQFKESKIRYHAIVYILHHGTIEDVDAEIDHSNGNKLDNRIENLRLVTKRENQQNRESHREGRLVGCSYHKCGKWLALIRINGKNIGLGLYNTEQEAHKVYNEALTMLDKSAEEIQAYFGVAQFSSEYKGVTYDKHCGKWKVSIPINGKHIHLGYYNTEEEAYAIYLKACELIELYVDNKQFRNLLNGGLK
jgi:hypothetical protein